MSKTSKDELPSTQDLVATKVGDAYATAVDKASFATRDVASLFENNPVAALLGGMALGAAAGALLPRSARERGILAPLGGTIAAAAAAAIAAGREAGVQALADSDLSPDALREQVSRLIGQATKAAGAAGQAAFSAARDAKQN